MTKKARVVPGKVWVGNPAKDIKVNDYKMNTVEHEVAVSETDRYWKLVEQRDI